MTPHFIHGEAFTEPNAKILSILNPAEAKPCGEVPLASDAVCQKALDAASQAFLAWSQTTPAKRAQILFKFRAILVERKEKLAALVTLEHGKTLEDALGSVARGIELVEWYCGLVSHWQTSLTAPAATGIDCYTLRQPLGVCLGVSPFNFPVMVPLWMMIPAIACGNTFILKPSEQTPSAPLLLAEWLTEAGAPPGVINVVHGGQQAVETLIAASEVQAVTAVASTPVAEHIYQQATRKNKRAHTFGGAKNHAVVMPDAELAQAAEAITGAAFGAAGERCMALSVVVAVGEQTADDLLRLMMPLIQAIRIEPGEVAGAQMGPLVSHAHRERVVRLIEAGVEEGAVLRLDGRKFVHPSHPEGYFLGPTLFDNVRPHMQIYQEEIFGPVLAVLRVDTFEQAIDLVNAHPYGNGSAIFTTDGGLANQYVSRVQAGMVGVNIPIPVPIVSHPFGGWKRSSFGNTPMHGEESLRFYTKHKSVTVRWPHTSSVAAPFSMPTNER